mmetsp:Transcript_8885/g.19185  ORF Transcript_8885/g.19185 Transcript_8885/m.19185 type:complete len:284 (+) Transcript_8885:140-991(+)|eukprot:CAMPEP_0168167916 /NCGR_PEP_ID=MMETSP0139_2-20121125/2793_1 /TAXON_ID=44445 /ORGANISM="Pseudo-nitzschia australis, Strain 10249 10 AB" /LENGTH=283 /DNA_ID=CAMNT_0008085167 /DNA_START=24 /DNA_END=875 /DNA_ORIENTATION=+
MSFFATTTSTTHNDLSHPSEWAPSEWAVTDTQMIPGDDDEVTLSGTSFQAAGEVLQQWLSDGQHEPHQRYHDGPDFNCNPDVTVIPCDSSASSVEHDDATADLASLMEVDEQIGENLLGDEVFGGPCDVTEGDHLRFFAVSLEDPTLMNSLSALNMVDGMSEEDRRFLAPLLEDSTTTTMDYDAGYVVTDVESLQQIPSLPPSPIMDQKRYEEITKKLEASMKRSQETRKSLTMKTPKTEKYNRRTSVTGVLSSIENSSLQLQTFLQMAQQTNDELRFKLELC